jgi:conjugation system TraG family ATPase
MRKLEEHIPLFGVEHNAILSKTGDVTIGFRVALPEIFSLSVSDYHNLHEQWVKAIRLLPKGTVLCKQDWFIEAKTTANFDEEMDFLSHSSEKHFLDRPYLEHHSNLLLTQTVANRKPSNSYVSLLLKKHLVPIEVRDEIRFREFLSAVGQFERILCSTGLISLERLTDDALVNTVNHYLNLGKEEALRDISFEKGIAVGEKTCVLFSVAESAAMPGMCSPSARYEKYSTDASAFPVSFTMPIGQLLLCNHLYCQYVFIGDAEKTLKELESQKRKLQSLSRYSRSNLIAMEATNDFLNEAVGAGRQPVRAHFNLLAWTDDQAKVPELRNQCAGALAQMGIRPKVETIGAPQLFWSGIPGNAGDFPINETLLLFTNQAACFFNMETTVQSSLSPIGIRLGDRVSGRPLHVDITEEPMQHGLISNRNKIIIGPSGSGKSFFVNHLVRSNYIQGAHVVIVDVGHSYRGVCETVGGYYFTYTQEKPIRFNPFHGEKPDVEKKESIKALLVTLWKKSNENFIRSEYVALSEVITGYYDEQVPVRNFNSFYEYIRDAFSGSQRNVRDKDFDITGLLYVLRPYYKGGEFDYLLNAAENLDLLEHRFIVFELDNIKDHPILFPVVTIVIMELFIAKMRALKGVAKKLYIEEAWKAITDNGMAEYMRYLSKTVRKHYGEIVVVSQEVDDLLSSPVIKDAIISNADCIILLDQSKYQNRFAEIQQLLGLSDMERSLALSLNKSNVPGAPYKEVFISLRGKAKVYRVEVSPEEYLVYTTEEKEKLRVTQAASKLGSMEMGIRSLLVLIGWLFCIGAAGQSIDPVSMLIAKAIKTIDLKIQRLQNQTLALQHAQQLSEQLLAKTKLAEIAAWQERLQQMYANYFEELKKLKPAVLETLVSGTKEQYLKSLKPMP